MWYLPVDKDTDTSLQDGSYKEDGDTNVDGDSSSVNDTACSCCRCYFGSCFQIQS